MNPKTRILVPVVGLQIIYLGTSMRYLYSFGIFSLSMIYRLAAWLNPKAKEFVSGRKEQSERLLKTFPLKSAEPLIWFHCASLGEFEQGRPVIEAIKAWRPSTLILLTFFSPSGYAVRKNYDKADFVFYLPWDTIRHARWFAETVKPALAVFVKYEFWYHYATELNLHGTPLISISALFRPHQIFFRPQGGFFRSILHRFDHFFVQNAESVRLLETIGITKVTKAGDTRFDRVHQIIQNAADLPIVAAFKGKKPMMVIGSAWPQDMDVLYTFINEHRSDLKFIVAPHELNDAFLHDIEKSLQAKSIRYSVAGMANAQEATVLIIDNIGLLSTLYRYGEYAFVGGAYSQGLHNILEATSYGIPVFFGDKAYQKYAEANELILRGGAFEVHDYMDLQKKFTFLQENPSVYQLACDVCRQYTEENLGATGIITEYCKKLLSAWKAS